MSLYKEGENMAFEALYSRHAKTVYSYLRRRIAGEFEIDEIHQNVFFKLHRNRSKYLPKYHFLKWLYTICRWELLDFIKRKNINLIPFDENNFHQATNEVNDGKIDIENSKNHSDNEKKALILKFYSDYDYEEISKILGLSQASTRKLLSRGVAKLKAKYQGGSNE